LKINLRSLISYLLLFGIIYSCSNKVIKRDRRGYRGGSARSKIDPRKFAVIRKKVALLNFFNESPYGGEDLSVTATAEARRELSRTGEFIIDPEGAKIFGSSKEIYSGGGVKLVQLARKAKLSGVNFVVYGRVKDARIRQKSDEIGFVRETKSYSESHVEIRVFDVNSNKEIFNEVFHGFSNDKNFNFYFTDRKENLQYRQELLRYAVQVAVRRSIPKLIDISAKMDWVGRVARIIGSKIYINAGRLSGINIGDVLKVITEGKEIFDPETGALIGVSKGDIKGTLEIIDYFGPDGTVSILHSGGSVTEGDFVQLY
jgi:hypothetical protein